MTSELSERDRAILDFEWAWWKHPGAKETEIRERFDLTPTRYYQLLNGFIDSPAALAYAPMTVKRLQRLRRHRQASRGRRVVG